jgi:ribonuclease J
MALVDDEDTEAREAALFAITEAVRNMKQSRRLDDEALKEAVRLAVRRSFRDSCGKRPVTQVHLVRERQE